MLIPTLGSNLQTRMIHSRFVHCKSIMVLMGDAEDPIHRKKEQDQVVKKRVPLWGGDCGTTRILLHHPSTGRGGCG